MFRVLIADDEMKIRETIRDYFSAKGFDIELAENGRIAVEKAEENDFDLIILDVMMPVKNGLDACEEIRKTSKVPILFLSALGEERDILKGYGNGCDDYIVKPFPLSVLHEKCAAMIKRYRGLDRDNRICVSGVTLDADTKKVYAGEKEIMLSSKDFQLLEYLMKNKNIVLDREIILSRIWGYDFDGDNRVVDTHIKIIRKALGESADCIKTVINAGYCFDETSR